MVGCLYGIYYGFSMVLYGLSGMILEHVGVIVGCIVALHGFIWHMVLLCFYMVLYMVLPWFYMV